jgi:leader peptidase (prepilin peptidase)/N-methyltransferase
MSLLLAALGLLGLAVGSFLNVVIARVPAGRSIVRPASACPECAAPIRARHNVPLLGWLWLRGRCADCANPIPVRYPLVELVTGVLFVADTLLLAERDRLALLPALLFFTAVGVALAVIDLDVQRLPNAIVYPTYPVLAALLALAALLESDPGVLLRAAVGAAALGVGYFVLALAYPGGMGLGDVKFAGAVGALLGAFSWTVLVVGAFAAFVLGGVAGVTLLALRRGTRRSALAFGPFMIAGALLAVFAGGPLAHVYTRLALKA